MIGILTILAIDGNLSTNVDEIHKTVWLINENELHSCTTLNSYPPLLPAVIILLLWNFSYLVGLSFFSDRHTRLHFTAEYDIDALDNCDESLQRFHCLLESGNTSKSLNIHNFGIKVPVILFGVHCITHIMLSCLLP